MNQVTMDELPELPFEKVLSYLSLKDRIKSMAVSRRWYRKIDSFRVKHLCYSNSPSGVIFRKQRLVNGSFAQNFICSTRTISFFATYRESILCKLKYLRLCDLSLNLDQATAFAETLQSFGQLEKLELNRFRLKYNVQELELNLPKLKCFQLEGLNDIKKLKLDAPELKKVKLMDSSLFLRVNFVHVETIENLVIADMRITEVKKLKNLKCLNGVVCLPKIDSDFLTNFKQLEEIYLTCKSDTQMIFEQKQRDGRTNLKIFFLGFQTTGLEDSIYCFNHYAEALVYLADNLPRLANEMPFLTELQYSAISRIAPEREISLLTKFSDLYCIFVDQPVQNVRRFLDLLKNLKHIVKLAFYCAQPQDLFDGLPTHCAVQNLFIDCPLPNSQFVFRLEHLMHLSLVDTVDADFIQRIFEELKYFSSFFFRFAERRVTIYPAGEAFQVWVEGAGVELCFDLNAVIQFILKSTQL